MIIANTSFHVDSRRATELVTWVEKVYLPGARKCEAVNDAVFLRILTSVDPAISAYAVQLSSDDRVALEGWCETEGARMLRFLTNKMGEHAVYFTTFMERLDG